MHLIKKKEKKEKKRKESQLKKIMPKTMNFGLPNLTKQKKKPRKTTKCHAKKNPRNTSKCHNIFAIFFLFPAVVGLSLILLFYLLHRQYFHNKS